MPRTDRSMGSMGVLGEDSLSTGAAYAERGSHNSNQGARETQNAEGARVRQALEPEKPTEFQRFVAATTGQILPIYGAGLFAVQPASFAPIEHAPAPENLVIGPEDELRVRIWGQINFSANLRVSREGEIYLPKVGAVHVAGLPFSAVAGQLRGALGRVFRNFELSVDMGEIHSIQVYVAGQARRPGEYTVSALSTLVDAVFLSGGPSGAGSMRHVQLKRAGKVVTDFDLYALLVKGDKSGDVALQPGDVLFIPAVGPEVALLGSVRLAGIYELRGEESIAALLEAAGGQTALATGGHLSVERIENHARRRVFELAMDAAGLATLLADGDIVRIDPIVSSYSETVTLRGSVATPGRFHWHEGMHLSELMPDRDSLVSRDYWWRRTQMGLPAPEFTPSIDSFSLRPGRQLQTLSTQNSLTSPDDDQAMGASVDSSTQRARASVTHSAQATGTLAESRTGNRTDNRMGKQTALLRPGSQTDWSYAVIERVDTATMTTSLIPFDLGKLVLQHDASQDLVLQPGDMVTIFSQDDIHQPMDRQTKYVRLEGEFVHPGVYSAAAGETLRSLVARAGGLTDKAYLYGSEFTRLSTMALEQQRLSEYADRLEHQMARGAIAASNSSSQPAGQLEQVASVSREMIARLRQLRSTGRIVLDLKPRDARGDDLPEASLEDGDRLLVPSTPATIQVIGAVINQNAFLYRDGARVGEYMNLAGGANRDADRKQTFVLRADGSVNSRQNSETVFSSSFENLRLNPGDTIVVPEKNLGPGVMREFLAWSQLFSQAALGAAAIDIIR